MSKKIDRPTYYKKMSDLEHRQYIEVLDLMEKLRSAVCNHPDSIKQDQVHAQEIIDFHQKYTCESLPIAPFEKPIELITRAEKDAKNS